MPAPRFVHRLRVRWSEVDAQHVVFNGHYLNYLDVAISEYWRAVGLPYPQGFAQHQGDLFARRNLIEYHAPARLDDWLDVGVRCARMGQTSLTIAWAACAHGRLLVSGEAVYVFTDLASARSAAVPAGVRAQIEAHEAGAAVHTLAVGPWATVGEAARAVRLAVFVQEQGIPEHEEWDSDDAEATHAVLTNLSGLPLATGRLLHAGRAPEAFKLGRMAVLRSSRGIGLGRRVLHALIAQARALGGTRLSLHAQLSAIPLYAAEGFVPEGPVFDEVGIAHQLMTRRL